MGTLLSIVSLEVFVQESKLCLDPEHGLVEYVFANGGLL
jgi:hypothetical protein